MRWNSCGKKASVVGVTLAMCTAVGGPTGSVLFVDDVAPPGGDGTSWATAVRFLQDALAVAADPLNGIAEIRVAEGTYPPDSDEASPAGSGERAATFQLINGVALRGGFAGLGAPDPDERDVELYETVLSGDLNGDDGPDFANNDENSYHVVTASGTDETAVLDGLTITAGNADGQENPRCFGGSSNGAACANDGRCPGGHCVSPNSLGAGVFVLTGRPTIENCRIQDNFAAFQGAGMLLKAGSHATITGCLISGNRALDNGGGMYLGLSSPTVVGCEFVDNDAFRDGGAMVNDEGSVIIDRCEFRDNYVSYSTGGVRVFSGTPALITNCLFVNNSVGELKGVCGALCANDTTIINCTFAGHFTLFCSTMSIGWRPAIV